MGPGDESKTQTDAVAAAARSARGDLRDDLGSARYRLNDLLGAGGMGEVYAARDEQLGRDVAVKRIRAAAPSASLVERFLREARIQGRLDHPAIVPVHELGYDAAGRPFFVMKKLAGTTLADILQTPESAARWGRQRLLAAFADVCLAVEFAHVHGVVHRDLKPSNVVLGEFGEVYVLDWGVAKVLGDTDVVEDLSPDAGLTGAGGVLGTPGYMAPEQQAGREDIDHRADVYSLGRMLERVLARAEVPELADACARATAEDPANRLATARELAGLVQRYLDGDRDVARRRELALEQLARARATLAGTDDDAVRRAAMEAAGRALALDPSLEEASTLIGGLLLQPPRKVPAAVDRALETDAHAWGAIRARGALRTHPFYLLAAITLIATGHYGYLAALIAVVALPVILDLLHGGGRIEVPSWGLPLMMAPLIALLSHLYSPFVVAPGLAAIVAVSLAMDPRTCRPRGTLFPYLVLVAAVLAPFVLERLGVVPVTVEQTPAGLLLHAPGLMSGIAQDVIYALYVMALLAAAVWLGHAMAIADREQRTRLHTIAWHLRSLLPASGPLPGGTLRLPAARPMAP